MKIELADVAKRYRHEWVLRNINLQLSAPGSYAVVGPNGAGKSTFLKIISGYLTPSKGKIRFFNGENTVSPTDIYRQLAIAAPYIDLIEEYTLEEALNFHQKFKVFAGGLTTQSMMSEVLGLQKHRHKPVRHFSSGMKQRLKLALAICSDAPLLLLDEPTTNLDRQGAAWYRQLVEQYLQDRLVVIASNVDEDMSFCSKKIDILSFK